MEQQSQYMVQGLDVLIVSIVVLFVGYSITERVGFLKRNNIPPSVSGGLLCSALIGIIYFAFDRQITFDMRMRDMLLLLFFSTIGLTAKFKMLREGGKTLGILLAVASVFLVMQDLTGVLLAKLMGAHPGYGLFGGSISFAGGYGTAIAWGDIAEEAGLKGAKTIGIACATFGLIAGGMIGGPIAGYLIKRHGLSPAAEAGAPAEAGASAVKPEAAESHAAAGANFRTVLGTVLVLCICVELGDLVNRFLFSGGVMLPGFLTAMMVGIAITNSEDVLGIRLSRPAIDQWNEISLQLFLSMSLMSMELWTLAQAAGPVLLVLLAQVTIMTIFAVLILFHLMGRDYDAAVISSGFAGLGLGATPVGIANMSAVTAKFGPSPKAFLVVPLVGAFFIDLVNVVVIKLFIAAPIIQGAPLP